MTSRSTGPLARIGCLRKLGYTEGQTIMFEIRFANGRLDQVRGLAAELVAARVDVIVAAGTCHSRCVEGSVSLLFRHDA